MGDAPVVLDPVMVAESGATLLADDARDALRDKLLPLASVTTPNLAEAEALAGAAGGPEELARAIHALGPDAVVVTGGHREAEATDVFFDGDRLEEIPGERYESGAAHGSGCTHSSALAAYLARGEEPLDAAQKGEGSRRAGGQSGPARRRPGRGAG